MNQSRHFAWIREKRASDYTIIRYFDWSPTRYGDRQYHRGQSDEGTPSEESIQEPDGEGYLQRGPEDGHQEFPR